MNFDPPLVPRAKSFSESDVCRQADAALLPWFATHARDLPWRRTLDPYAVWVSEVMLQQTQVKTVIPYFDRWLAALPDVAALATAQEERVLKLWEGLGYYTRARNLQRAARLVADDHGGRFPDSPTAILELPGIGRYTAGAIASIAFNQTTPILDGNVIRVLTRLLALPSDPKERRLNERLWTIAAALVKTAGELPRIKLRSPMKLAGNHSALNQALMELGATVCTPISPKCPACPLAGLCAARRLGRPEAFPESARRPSATARRFVAVVFQRRGRLCVQPRPTGVVNAGLWEFPNVELSTPEADAIASAATLFEIPPEKLSRLMTVRHSITRYRITVEVLLAAASARKGLATEATWLDAARLNEIAFTSAHRKIAHRVMTK